MTWLLRGCPAAVMTEEIEKRERNQVRWLEGVAAGRVSLAVAQAPPQSGGVPEIMSAPRVFSRKKWGGDSDGRRASRD